MTKSAGCSDPFFKHGYVFTIANEGQQPRRPNSRSDQLSNFSGHAVKPKMEDKDSSFARAALQSLPNEEETLTATPLSARSVRSAPTTLTYLEEFKRAYPEVGKKVHFQENESSTISSSYSFATSSGTSFSKGLSCSAELRKIDLKRMSKSVNFAALAVLGKQNEIFCSQARLHMENESAVSDFEILGAEFVCREEDKFHILFTTRNREGLISRGLEELAYGQHLAAGGFSKITTMVKDTQSQIREEAIVFKYARKKKGADSVADVCRDFDNSKKIFSRGRSWGIKPPPICKITLPRLGENAELQPAVRDDKKLNNPAMREGFLEIKYDMDLKDLITSHKKIQKFLPVDNALHIGHQVLSGISFFEDKEIINNDMKPRNVLIRKNGDGFYEARLSDFGGALFMDELEDYVNLKEFTSSVVYTSIYTSRLDYKLSKLFISENKINKYFELEVKKLTFSAGLILYAVFTNRESPYPHVLDSNNRTFLCVTKPLKPVDHFRRDLNPDLTKLIHDMLEPDYRLRPTPSQAKNRLDEILAAHYPDVNAKIESVMQKMGYLT